MIDFLIGKVFRKNPVSTTILVNEAIGYEVFIPLCYHDYKENDILNLDIVHIQKEMVEKHYMVFLITIQNYFLCHY